MKTAILILIALSLGWTACLPVDSTNSANNITLEQFNSTTNSDNLGYRDTVYIPIYSSIYSKTKDVLFNLTATLSIRNTSLYDTLYLDGIDYYDTEGELVRAYLKEQQTLALHPLQSIEYVIEEKDIVGGTSADFIIEWAAVSNQVKPIFQGVMISTNGQQGISFVTDGHSISRR
ncbi:MAG: DUF3124 domain-containing protein [Aureispira sp.]